jgi:membrane protease YdiL (CAAX protease family)
VYGPLFAALIVTLLEQGREGLATLMARVFRWKLSIKWYLVVLFINLVLLLIPLLVGAIAGLMPIDDIRFTTGSYLLFFFIVQAFTSGLGEESGWRGFLYPRLKQNHEQSRAVWYMGLIWAVWHYPFVILFSFGATTQEPSFYMLINIALSLAGFTMSIIGMSFIYAWLINSTKSILLAILFHALNNVIPLVIVGGFDASLTIVLAIAPWILVVIMQRLYGRSWFVAKDAVVCAR